MDGLINFFALRPTFTLIGLRTVWYIYLFNALVQLVVAVSGTFELLAQRGILLQTWWPNFLPLILGVISQVALVRLLLEVAATVLFSSRPVR